MAPTSGYDGVPQAETNTTTSGAFTTAPTSAPQGVPFDAQSGSTYIIALTDRAHVVQTTNNTTSTAVTIPATSTTGFGLNIPFVHCNTGSVIATDTVTTNTINGNAAAKLVGAVSGHNPECMFVWNDLTNYWGAEILPTDANGKLAAEGFPTNFPSFTIPSGATLTVASGGTLTCAGGSTCPSGGSSRLDQITAATGANTIANGNNDQVWNWLLTGSTDGIDFGEASGSPSTGTGAIVGVNTQSNSTAIPSKISQGSITTAANPGTNAPNAYYVAGGAGGPASSGNHFGGNAGGIFLDGASPGANSGTVATGNPGQFAGDGNDQPSQLTIFSPQNVGTLGGPHLSQAAVLMVNPQQSASNTAQNGGPLTTEVFSPWDAGAVATWTFTTLPNTTNGYNTGDLLQLNAGSTGCEVVWQVTNASTGATAIYVPPSTISPKWPNGIPRAGVKCTTGTSLATITTTSQGGTGTGSGAQVTISTLGAATYAAGKHGYFPCTTSNNSLAYATGNVNFNICHGHFTDPGEGTSSGISNYAEFWGTSSLNGGVMLVASGGGGGTFYGVGAGLGFVGGGVLNFQTGTATNAAQTFDLGVVQRGFSNSGYLFTVNTNAINGANSLTLNGGAGCGVACSGNTNGGDLYLAPGLTSGSGSSGILHLGTYSTGAASGTANSFAEGLKIDGSQNVTIDKNLIASSGSVINLQTNNAALDNGYAAPVTSLTDFLCDTNTGTIGSYTCTTDIGTTQTFFTNQITVPTAATANTIDGVHSRLSTDYIFDAETGSGTVSTIQLTLFSCTSSACSTKQALWTSATFSLTASQSLPIPIHCELYGTATATTFMVGCYGRTFTPATTAAPVVTGVKNTGTNWIIGWALTYGAAGNDNMAVAQNAISTQFVY